MTTKVRKIVITLFTFIVVFILHIVYFGFTEGACEDTSWFKKYIEEQEYFLGSSYALSIAFVAFAFLKFKENRKRSLQAAFGGGILAIILWFLCFLFGCCGSPMLIVYLNLIGISSLKIPKLALLFMTIIFIGIGYIWLIKKMPQSCCEDKTCRKTDNEEI